MNDDGDTSLFIAAEENDEAIVATLLAAGADVNQARTDNGATPLYIASQEGHEVIVEALIAAGADVNKARSDTGGTPLFIAAQKGHEAIVAALVAEGARVHHFTNSGRTARDAARMNGHHSLMRVLAFGFFVLFAAVVWRHLQTNNKQQTTNNKQRDAISSSASSPFLRKFVFFMFHP